MLRQRPIDPRERGEKRDEEAVTVAERWWPNRYVGDLTTAEWRRVYEALDATVLCPPKSDCLARQNGVDSNLHRNRAGTASTAPPRHHELRS